MKKILFILLCIGLLSCSQKPEIMKPYVIEITTFKYKATVNAHNFWKEDAKIQDIYTSKQPGYISRESGYSEETNEVLVVVKWETMTDADASMKKFMSDASVVDFANMINASTLKMARYNVK